MNQTTSIFKVLGDGAGGGLEGASEGPGLFDPRESLWSLLLNLLDEELIGALKARLFCAGQSYPQTKVIFQTSWLIRWV